MLTNEKPTMRQEQAAETRQKLLDSAAKLFAEKGYARTQVRSISRSIGVADGLMYHYFPGGKREIIQVLVLDNFKLALQEFEGMVPALDQLPLDEMIEEIYQSWSAVFERHQDIFKILFKENEVMHLVEQRQLLHIAQNSTYGLPKILEKRANEGEVREMDYESATYMLASLLLCHFVSKIVGGHQGPLSNDILRKRIIKYQVNLWKK